VKARLVLLGRFELWRGAECLHLPMPAQRLLAFLALHDRRIFRSYAAGTLWPETTDDRALGSLRSAVWQLHRLDSGLVKTTQHALEVAPGIGVDVREATAWARRVLGSASEFGDHELAATWLNCDLLPDWYDDWVLPQREHFRELRVRALEALSARLTTEEKFGQAAEAAIAAVEAEPLRESAHRSLIAVYLAEGNEAEAIQWYRRFCQRLRDEVGLAPSGRMEELLSGLHPPLGVR
jgi:DNA-binding SARP family transcriptional activator